MKKILLIGMLFVILFALVGCGSDASEREILATKLIGNNIIYHKFEVNINLDIDEILIYDGGCEFKIVSIVTGFWGRISISDVEIRKLPNCKIK